MKITRVLLELKTIIPGSHYKQSHCNILEAQNGTVYSCYVPLYMGGLKNNKFFAAKALAEPRKIELYYIIMVNSCSETVLFCFSLSLALSAPYAVN